MLSKRTVTEVRRVLNDGQIEYREYEEFLEDGEVVGYSQVRSGTSLPGQDLDNVPQLVKDVATGKVHSAARIAAFRSRER